MDWMERAREGFAALEVSEAVKSRALANLALWLEDAAFADYVPQIRHLIETRRWDLLLDSFYQVIPFGTGGRRGPVGIGPNRINPWTIQASAQGHSQYLLRHHGDEARRRGVVMAFDVRRFEESGIYAADRPNPVRGLDGLALARAAAEVYAANGIRVLLFDSPRSTPELSFAIRRLGAVAGDMFSASHNLPPDNGKKVYDAFGGQLIPPEDQALVDEVTRNVREIRRLPFAEALRAGRVEILGDEIDDAFHEAVCRVSLSPARQVRIFYSPLHGTGTTSVLPVLRRLGFAVTPCPATSPPSGRFERVTFQIPNPEVVESFDASRPLAERDGADLLLSTDPDADRIGVLVRHRGEWVFLNGNEIALLLALHAIGTLERSGRLAPGRVIVKTEVTTSLIDRMAARHGIRCIGDLLVGFKYIAAEMNRLEAEGRGADFLFGCEESHGYLAGTYARDKDAAGAAVWLAEYAAELKASGRTLCDALEEIYCTYGCGHNHLTEIRLLGAQGMEQIAALMAYYRTARIERFGDFAVVRTVDRWQGEPQPHLSETDTAARNAVVFHLADTPETDGVRITVRPSGTEPKIKMYFELLGKPCGPEELPRVRARLSGLRERLERSFMLDAYRRLGIDFPERGFLLFWQLPLKDKLRYFEIEDDIARLKERPDPQARKQELDRLLGFLGSNPVEKIDRAFRARFGCGVREFLELPA